MLILCSIYGLWSRLVVVVLYGLLASVYKIDNSVLGTQSSSLIQDSSFALSLELKL